MFLPETLTNEAIELFSQQLAGGLLRPGEELYQQQRTVFNRVGSPAFIAQCATVNDVITAVKFATQHALTLTVRGGGHGLNGTATNDGGLVIDLALLNKVTILDEAKRLVRVEGGAVWGDVAHVLHPHGLALTSGDTSTVGVGGLTLGGGIGWMVRKYGLTIDAFRAAEVVLADGSVIRVSDQAHSELFWALRGGGGNFGVVTAFEFEVEKVTNVVFGSLYFNAADDFPGILKGWRDVSQSAPRELTTHCSVMPLTLTRPRTIMITVCYAADDPEAAKAAIEPFTAIGPLVHQELQHLPYSSVIANHGRAKFGAFKLLHRTQFMKEFTDEAIEVITQNFGQPQSPMLQLRILGGAMADVSSAATAFGFRDATLLATAMQGVSGDYDTQNREMSRVWQPLERFAHGSYINFIDNSDDAAERSFLPQTLTKLQAVKKQYDPQNVFGGTIALVATNKTTPATEHHAEA